MSKKENQRKTSIWDELGQDDNSDDEEDYSSFLPIFKNQYNQPSEFQKMEKDLAFVIDVSTHEGLRKILLSEGSNAFFQFQNYFSQIPVLIKLIRIAFIEIKNGNSQIFKFSETDKEEIISMITEIITVQIDEEEDIEQDKNMVLQSLFKDEVLETIFSARAITKTQIGYEVSDKFRNVFNKLYYKLLHYLIDKKWAYFVGFLIKKDILKNFIFDWNNLEVSGFYKLFVKILDHPLKDIFESMSSKTDAFGIGDININGNGGGGMGSPFSFGSGGMGIDGIDEFVSVSPRSKQTKEIIFIKIPNLETKESSIFQVNTSNVHEYLSKNNLIPFFFQYLEKNDFYNTKIVLENIFQIFSQIITSEYNKTNYRLYSDLENQKTISNLISMLFQKINFLVFNEGIGFLTSIISNILENERTLLNHSTPIEDNLFEKPVPKVIQLLMPTLFLKHLVSLLKYPYPLRFFGTSNKDFDQSHLTKEEITRKGELEKDISLVFKFDPPKNTNFLNLENGENLNVGRRFLRNKKYFGERKLLIVDYLKVISKSSFTSVLKQLLNPDEKILQTLVDIMFQFSEHNILHTKILEIFWNVLKHKNLQFSKLLINETNLIPNLVFSMKIGNRGHCLKIVNEIIEKNYVNDQLFSSKKNGKEIKEGWEKLVKYAKEENMKANFVFGVDKLIENQQNGTFKIEKVEIMRGKTQKRSRSAHMLDEDEFSDEDDSPKDFLYGDEFGGEQEVVLNLNLNLSNEKNKLDEMDIDSQ